MIATSSKCDMVNAYDFGSDNEVNNDLSDIGRQLPQVNKSKDSLIKLLKVNRNVSGGFVKDTLKY